MIKEVQKNFVSRTATRRKPGSVLMAELQQYAIATWSIKK